MLLFDELHVMDRPSFSFGQGHGGLIGAPSPFRDFETFFRNEGIPIYVHRAPGGPVPDEFYVVLQAKQATIGPDADYSGTIDKLVKTEILPAARNFKNKLDTIGDNLFGKLATGVVTALGSSALIDVFMNLSWENLLLLGGGAGAYLIKAAIESFFAERAAKRECSISYILALDH